MERGYYFETIILILCVIVHRGGAFFDMESVASVAAVPSGKDQCVWYGHCGPGWNPETSLNCPATDKTRFGPYLNSSRGLDILKRMCPDLYKGDTNTRTCCSEGQLIELEANMVLPQQLLARCPSCFRNFRNYFCQLTCGLNQNQFIWPDMKKPYPPGYSYTPKGIPAIYILLTNHFANGFYNSCKDVSMPSFHDKAISMFCGTSAKSCTPFKLFSYIGNVGNGRASFPETYVFRDNPWISPDKTVLTPLNATIIPCNQSYANESVCACQDCQASCLGIPCPTDGIGYVGRRYYSALKYRPMIRRFQLALYRPNNKTQIKHRYPPPSPSSINFTSMFGKEFMHEVLNLQNNISSYQVASLRGENFTLRDICYKPGLPENDGCAIESVLQYWQNNGTNIDKVVWDEWGLFVLADYLDHFLSCSQNPYAVLDTTKLNMSCLADYGAAMKPMDILGGYTDANYQNATSFVMSFYLNTTNEEMNWKADRWMEEINAYAEKYPTKDMAICVWP